MQSKPSHRVASLVLTVLWGWTVMTVTHELGHVVAGEIGGGKLVQLELRPWHLPHSLLVGDRFPLITVWAGPIVGILAPIAVAALLRRQPVWMVAWFCLLANGCYLLLGLLSDGPELDTNKMIAAGTPTAVVAIFSTITTAIGYWKFRQSCMHLLESKQPVQPKLIGSMFIAWMVINGMLSLT